MLSERYEEIRNSPLASQIKRDYEDRLEKWSEKYEDLQADYSQLKEDNYALQSDLSALQREYGLIGIFIF